MIDPGQMRTRFVYREAIDSRDPDGGAVETVVDRFELWGSLRSLKGYEVHRARSAQSNVTHEVVIRNRRDVRPGGLLRLKSTSEEGRSLRIESVRDPDGNRCWAVLACTEMVV